MIYLAIGFLIGIVFMLIKRVKELTHEIEKLQFSDKIQDDAIDNLFEIVFPDDEDVSEMSFEDFLASLPADEAPQKEVKKEKKPLTKSKK